MFSKSQRMKKREEKNFYEGNVEISPVAAGLNRIYKAVQKDGFAKDICSNLRLEIDRLAAHFGISEKGVVLLAYLAENAIVNSSDADELSAYIGCSNLEFIGFHAALDELESRGIILRGATRNRRVCYLVSREAARAIETGDPFIPVYWTGISIDEFFTRLRIFFSDFRKELTDAETLLGKLVMVVERNPELTFCRKVMDSPLFTLCSDTEQRIFFYLCHRRVSFGDESVDIDILMNLISFLEDEQRIRRQISTETTMLQKQGLVTFGGKEGFQDTASLALSEDAVQTFLADVPLFRVEQSSCKDLIKASSIVRKELFYNEEEAGQIERLDALLREDSFREVQARLTEMGMRRGFAVLFSGGAGCGKTAAAYELARRSGRDVFAVDMASLKSKWVGDSEKIVKGVFTRYAELCRRSAKAPILLFNEADAIFARRLEDPRDSVDQMMNALQNICLDAMENLEGILIATTNLAANFCDEAFARRFLFKVEFSTPEPDTREKIWRSLVGELSGKDAAVLAGRYEFSGGNIENVARKAAVGYVLSGRKADREQLIRYCDEEMVSVGRKSRRIGF